LADAGQVVGDVAAAVGLAEGEAGVRAVIATLARLEPVSIRHVSRTVELPVPIVAAVCGELRKRALVAEERPARLTPAGRRLFSTGGLELGRGGSCRRCHGRGIVVPRPLGRLAPEIEARIARAPAHRLELDQCHCTVDTKLRRVLALHDADALVGRRVLLLGDDDLTSIAVDAVVRSFGTGATVARLAVLDVDPEILAFVERELSDARFPVSCVRHDLREPLPPSLVGAFDTVVTDPPFTVEGAVLFLSRAADALAGAGGDVILSFGSRRPGAALGIQRAIAQMGFAVRRLVRDFNEYVGAGVLGGTSHLYHLAATSELRPLVAGRFDGPLYTADQRPDGTPSSFSQRPVVSA
jgi:N4-bis(aminopropyl)spermidine synthase